jgi:Cys-rich protein (TIGR01571 family)
MASTEATPLSSAPLGSADDIVLHGAWRDDIFDCFNFGFCHPSVCMACFFPQLLMAQILTRLKRNLWGVPEPNGGYEKTFRHMVFLVLAYYIPSSLLKPPVPSTLKESHGHTITVENEHYPLWKNILYNLVFYAYAVYTFVILVRLRATIRRQYEIPVRYFGALEDGCCAFWLSCCTLAQLARQTANYQEKRALFCSNNGLAPSSSTLTMDV